LNLVLAQLAHVLTPLYGQVLVQCSSKSVLKCVDVDTESLHTLTMHSGSMRVVHTDTGATAQSRPLSVKSQFRKWTLDTHSVHSVKDERCAPAAFTMSRTREARAHGVHSCKSEYIMGNGRYVGQRSDRMRAPGFSQPSGRVGAQRRPRVSERCAYTVSERCAYTAFTMNVGL
jgi:hypothetical protein